MLCSTPFLKVFFNQVNVELVKSVALQVTSLCTPQFQTQNVTCKNKSSKEISVTGGSDVKNPQMLSLEGCSSAFSSKDTMIVLHWETYQILHNWCKNYEMPVGFLFVCLFVVYFFCYCYFTIFNCGKIHIT